MALEDILGWHLNLSAPVMAIVIVPVLLVFALVVLPDLMLFMVFALNCHLRRVQLKPRPAKLGSTLKIATYNIQKFHNMRKHFNIDEQIDVIRALNVQICALQEVSFDSCKTNECPESEEVLAAKFGFTEARFFEGKRHRFQRRLGNAILSNYPILETRVLEYKRSSCCGFYRSAVCCRIELPGKRQIWVISTHLQHDPSGEDQAYALVLLESFVKKLRESAPRIPVVIMGDFNMSAIGAMAVYLPNFLSRAGWVDAVESCGCRKSTFPSSMPLVRLDHIIIATEEYLEPVKVDVYRSTASDHLPVVAELRLCVN